MSGMLALMSGARAGRPHSRSVAIEVDSLKGEWDGAAMATQQEAGNSNRTGFVRGAPVRRSRSRSDGSFPSFLAAVSLFCWNVSLPVDVLKLSTSSRRSAQNSGFLFMIRRSRSESGSCQHEE